MATTVLPLGVETSSKPSTDSWLKASAWAWCVTAVIGQMAFIYFIVAFYGPSTASGNFADWNKKNLITGHVPGDTAGNLQFAVHVLMGAMITASGALQLLPQIRRYVPALHRWNGRFYIMMALLMSLGGMSLVWVRGTYLTLTGALGISLLGVLLMGAAIMAWRTAVARDFRNHPRWALRTFLLANGVWFQRIGYMAWILVNRGPVGIGKRMDGPFDLFWGFGSFLLPLAVLELYFFVRDRGGARAKSAMAGGLVVLTLLTALGIGGAYMLMWRPVLLR
ncbi:DUF2306 domain-containing protein [Sphingobium sp. AS12]|uniref:DUF2306 domain-containing protein n=1 Tax=Sphingobium sp. AS12 TaxID=2849495 RepID=UPI001C31DB38|nr:DUF2306 domain-containing protein [Sphingobium sp. AS12]MBV2149858.1 DUF2306 domain-containing protein [Sphingobium sp. AS12]